MKSGVKRHFPQQRSQDKNVLAAQDDRSNGVRRDRRVQVVWRPLAVLNDMGGGSN
jgi:hypothetical protein